MDKIEVKKELETNYRNALECLGILPESIVIKYEYNTDRFNSCENAAETSPGILYINEAWIDMIIQVDDRYDIKFLMYHEARHMYQFNVISEFKSRGKSSELPNTINQWIASSESYIRNTGKDTIDANANQIIEIDANAFAILLLQIQDITQARLNPIVEIETINLVKDLAQKYRNRIASWKDKLV